MRVAVVKDNLITNVIVSDAPDDITTFPLPPGKWIGDTYADQPPATLEDRVAALETAAANDRAALMLLLTGEEAT